MSDANHLLPFNPAEHVYRSTLKGPPGTDVGDLACELFEDPEYHSIVTASAWEVNEDQKAMIAAGAHLRMTVWQHPIPPLGLRVEGPFCGGCSTEKIWDGRQFVCTVPDCEGGGGNATEDDRHASRDPNEERVREDFTPAPEDEDPDGH